MAIFISLVVRTTVPAVLGFLVLRFLSSFLSRWLRPLDVRVLGSSIPQLVDPWFYLSTLGSRVLEFWETSVLSFLHSMVLMLLRSVVPGLRHCPWSSSPHCLGSLITLCLDCVVPQFFGSYGSGLFHRPCSIHTCVGCHDQTDAVHPSLFPCERCRLRQLQRYRKAAAVGGSGAWTHHHSVEVAGRYKHSSHILKSPTNVWSIQNKVIM